MCLLIETDSMVSDVAHGLLVFKILSGHLLLIYIENIDSPSILKPKIDDEITLKLLFKTFSLLYTSVLNYTEKSV